MTTALFALTEPSVAVHGATGEAALAEASARQHAMTTALRPASE